MKRLFLAVMLWFAAAGYIPEAEAEPVTMVILAPIALEAAKQASPYAIAGLKSGGMQLLEVGKDLANIFRLPLGVLQISAGLPLGLAGQGWENILMGCCAPFQLVGDVLLLPVSFLKLP